MWVLHVKDHTRVAVSSLFSYVDHRKAGVAGSGGLGLARTDSTTEECMDTACNKNSCQSMGTGQHLVDS